MPTLTVQPAVTIVALVLAGLSGSVPARCAPGAGITVDNALSGSAATAFPIGGASQEKNPVIEFDTTLGKIKIELNSEKAPITVKNFLEYVNSGFYNGTIFHRVIPGFMIQGGGFTPDLTEKPTREPIRNEAGNGLSNLRGTIAMARTQDPDSATAQFFINVVDNSTKLDRRYALDGAGYAVFGKVTSGMDVADKIVAVKTTGKGPMPSDVPEETVLIKTARVVSK